MGQHSNVTSAEQAKSIMTLQSGKTIEQPNETKKLEDQNVAELKLTQDQRNQELRDEQNTLEPSYVPRTLYQSDLKSCVAFSQKGGKIEEMLKLFKQVQINLPFLDVIIKLDPKFQRRFVSPNQLVRCFNTLPPLSSKIQVHLSFLASQKIYVSKRYHQFQGLVLIYILALSL